MDYIWTPWRYQYIVGGTPKAECVFCTKAAANTDEANYVVYRARLNFVLLNYYPYTNGHLMIAPYQHVATLEEATAETVSEMMTLTREAERHLRALYRPEGFNVGMNIGKCAGAGVAGHIHMHVVPRWTGDSSFMTVVGETRLIPEDLGLTYQKLEQKFRGA